MKTSRRNFVKRAALLGSGVCLLRSTSTAAETPSNPPANPTLATLHGLRTIHGNFSNQPLPEGAVDTILQASVCAANASNNQSYSVIVIRDRALMKSVCGYAGACLLLFCADYNRMKASAQALGYDYEPGTITDFVTATINTTLAAQTAVVAAKSLGIDSLLTNGIHRGDLDRHWQLLDLPEKHCFPVIALVLGYPKQEPGHRKGRLRGAGVFHEGKYHRLTESEVAEISRTYDDKERNVALVDDWNKRGHVHYLDWYFKEWVGVGSKSALESPMLRRLRRSGFVESAGA